VFNIFSRLFSKKKTEKESAPTPHPYNYQNNVTDGFKLCVTMQSNVPLSTLKRHGEKAEVIPKSDLNLSLAHAVWVPAAKKEFDFLDEGASMASAIGYVPKDGGALLDYLCKSRDIIEAKLELSKDLFQSFKRIDALKFSRKAQHTI
jgi:hypothetical protein